MSRGLSREAARKVIVLGFLEPVVARIPLPEAQERLRGAARAEVAGRSRARPPREDDDRRVGTAVAQLGSRLECAR